MDDDELEVIKLDKHYQFLLKEFSDKIPERIKFLWNETKTILRGMGLTEKVRIDKECFENAILDYFTDVLRIKGLTISKR
jgi:hypothetical protein